MEGQREPGRRKRPQCPRENLSFTPRKAIPASLPPSGYAGLYYHPGYQYLNVVVSDELQGAVLSATPVPQLHAEQPDTDFRFKCDFVHVPGENWIMYVDLMDAPTLTVPLLLWSSGLAVMARSRLWASSGDKGMVWMHRFGIRESALEMHQLQPKQTKDLLVGSRPRLDVDRNNISSKSLESNNKIDSRPVRNNPLRLTDSTNLELALDSIRISPKRIIRHNHTLVNQRIMRLLNNSIDFPSFAPQKGPGSRKGSSLMG